MKRPPCCGSINITRNQGDHPCSPCELFLLCCCWPPALRRPSATKACGPSTIFRPTRSRRPTGSGPTRHGSITCACRRFVSRAAAPRHSFRRAAWCRPTIIAPAAASSSFRHRRTTSSPTASTRARSKDEVKCPDVEVNQLVDISDVTARITEAACRQGRPRLRRRAEGRAGQHRPRMLRQRRQHPLRRGRALPRRRLQSLQVSPLPGRAARFRAGTCDRLLRRRSRQFRIPALQSRRQPTCGSTATSAPLDTSANFLRYATTDAQPGDLTFISGHPGSTRSPQHRGGARVSARRSTSALDFRDLGAARGVLTEFSRKGAEQARIAEGLLFGIENGLKASKGEFFALVDSAIIKDRAAAEQDLARQGRRRSGTEGAVWPGLGRYSRHD